MAPRASRRARASRAELEVCRVQVRRAVRREQTVGAVFVDEHPQVVFRWSETGVVPVEDGDDVAVVAHEQVVAVQVVVNEHAFTNQEPSTTKASASNPPACRSIDAVTIPYWLSSPAARSPGFMCPRLVRRRVRPVSSNDAGYLGRARARNAGCMRVESSEGMHAGDPCRVLVIGDHPVPGGEDSACCAEPSCRAPTWVPPTPQPHLSALWTELQKECEGVSGLSAAGGVVRWLRRRCDW